MSENIDLGRTLRCSPAFCRSTTPDEHYRTTPLKGLFTRARGGFYHDGRFATLAAAVDHYERALQLSLSSAEQGELVESLKSL